MEKKAQKWSVFDSLWRINKELTIQNIFKQIQNVTESENQFAD